MFLSKVHHRFVKGFRLVPMFFPVWLISWVEPDSENPLPHAILVSHFLGDHIGGPVGKHHVMQLCDRFQRKSWMNDCIYGLTSPTKLGCQSLRTLFFGKSCYGLNVEKTSPQKAEKKLGCFVCFISPGWFASNFYPTRIYSKTTSPFFRHAPNQRIIQPLESLDPLMEGCFWNHGVWKGWSSSPKKLCLAILCDLFGMVKWPFQGVKWPPTRGWKGHFESPGGFCLLILVGEFSVQKGWF